MRARRDPIAAFREYFRKACASGMEFPDAMALATATGTGRPSVRIVLLKQVDRRGLVFFTNYASRKGRELAANPRAAIAIHWPALGLQARAEGRVRRIGSEESDAYWATRPRGSRLSAASSPQSRPVESRRWLEQKAEAARRRWRGRSGPRPASWGGYRLVPDSIEFWSSRPDRLHERHRYRRNVSIGAWRVSILAP
jgi:pyridoxamine 5'-phosphate oxidase